MSAATPEPKKPREKCAYCGKRKYKEYLELIFIHPVICKGGIYACKEGVRGRIWYRSPSCIDPLKAEINLYHETGTYRVVEAAAVAAPVNRKKK